MSLATLNEEWVLEQGLRSLAERIWQEGVILAILLVEFIFISLDLNEMDFVIELTLQGCATSR